MVEQIVREYIDGEWVTTHASAGGGGSFPDSWLVVDAGLFSASGDCHWALDGNSGTDAVIDGVDDTQINIVTAGVYTVLLQAEFGGDATGAGFAEVNLYGTGSTLFRQSWPNDFDTVFKLDETIIPASYLASRSVVYPAISVASPPVTVLGTGAVSITATAGSISISGVSLLIRRIA